jgi:hypothetical protein
MFGTMGKNFLIRDVHSNVFTMYTIIHLLWDSVLYFVCFFFFIEGRRGVKLAWQSLEYVWNYG